MSLIGLCSEVYRIVVPPIRYPRNASISMFESGHRGPEHRNIPTTIQVGDNQDDGSTDPVRDRADDGIPHGETDAFG